MVNYTCPRCGYESHIKTIYMRHLSRKKICENILSDDNLINEYIKYNVKEKLMVIESTKSQQLSQNSQQKVNKKSTSSQQKVNI